MPLYLSVMLLVLTTLSSLVQAQVNESVPTGNPPAATTSLRDRVTESDLEEAQKTQTLALIGQAEKQTADAKAKSELAKQRAAALETVTQRAEAARQSIRDLKDFKPSVAQNLSLADLEASLATLTESTRAAKQALAASESAMKDTAQRRAVIDAELPKLTASLEERKQQLQNAMASGDATLVGEAIVAELKSSVESLQADIEAIKAEKALLDAEVAASLPQVTRDLKARQVETMEAQLATLQQAVENERVDDATKRLRKAQQMLPELPAVLQPIGQRNEQLAMLIKHLARDIESATDELNERTEELDNLSEQFEQATDRVDKVGLTDAVGAMLRNLKQNLPSIRVNQLRIRQRASKINDANYQLMEMTDRRNQRLGMTIDGLMRDARESTSSDQRESLSEEARELLQEQRTEYLDPAIRAQSEYFNTMVSISTVEDEIIQLVEKASKYINENVLWIRSTRPLYTHPVPSSDEWWFTLPSAWGNVWSRIWADLLERSAAWLVAFMALATLILSRYRLRAEIGHLGEKASQSSFSHFMPTAKAFLWTVATAVPVPLAFGFLGSRFGSVAGNDRTLAALSQACIGLAYAYFPLDFLRQVCRTHGLAESHFGWPAQAIAKIRRPLRLLLWGAVPLAAFAAFLAGGTSGYGNDVLERYVVLAACVILGVFVYRVAHPRRGAPARYLASDPEGWLNRLSYIWYPGLIAIPVSLGALTVIGYHFTSQQIGWRFFQSLGLLFGIGVAVSLTMRWSLVHRRRLRIEQAKALRASLQRQSAEQGETAPSEGPITIPSETAADLQEQMNQSRSLFQTAMASAALVGLWLVWRDVIPALGIFEKWPLWSTTDSITEAIKDDKGNFVTQSREVIDLVTITDVGLAVLIFIVTIAAARNLPGLLEFAVLRRLPLDRSVRYAVTTLVSYAIVMLGLIVAGGTIGLHWNQIQWMATALTFGLAFGLQEMFANFIAGIIILFEQPVRVGDVVEIDGVTGVVSKIRIRATTITDWDRKDYIVPNKEFITGKLLNWTRSDEIVRISVAVGIAYGSDTSMARKLLLESAAEHPDVLSDPPTLATFDGFGDNSLNFTLRVFVSTYEKRFHICNDLHMSIDNKFRDAGIEISFPQRDLHLRSLPNEIRHFFESTSSKNNEATE
ncbi:mechanosensitive ion channel domain-containing protein [Stieleria varia]|uniref:Mechanosensitive channel MscK n=1 Tax=Stieleria varia TaxID=2528005 RepID=A0A5C6APR7_9BACT|nr:mechanosensitive ion channel domain-containing protein [Stieleria varia]TWU00962.1 Mechanosensitive channel MscK precursor [Stieleria varia]